MGAHFRTEIIDITTGHTVTARDVTAECEDFLRRVDAADGLLNVFVPHATAGIAVIETGAGSDTDLLAAIEELLPADDRWRHRHGSPGHGRDHVLPGFIAPHATLPVVGGRLELGTWQSVVFIDTNVDNPRREMRLTFLG